MSVPYPPSKRILWGRLTPFLNCQEIQWFKTLFEIQSLILFPVTYNLIYVPECPVLSKILWDIAYDWDERELRIEEVKEMEQRILKDLKEAVDSLIKKSNLTHVSKDLNRVLRSFLK